MAFDVASEREILGVDIPVALKLDSCIAISYQAQSERSFALNPKEETYQLLEDICARKSVVGLSRGEHVGDY